MNTAIRHLQYHSRGGIRIRRSAAAAEYSTSIDKLARNLDSQRGVLLASSFEYPGRYTRWDLGFVNPPLEVSGQGRNMTITALNRRGKVLLPEVRRALRHHHAVETCVQDAEKIALTVCAAGEGFSEEQRSTRPSVFSILRGLVSHFYSDQDAYLGLYGAFGYDLTFQFEDIDRVQARGSDHRDLVLYLPDEIIVADHRSEVAVCYRYEFDCRGEDDRFTETTGGFGRSGTSEPYVSASEAPVVCDHQPGEYAATVNRAIDCFRRGDLFEAVPGQVFLRAVSSPAFDCLRSPQREQSGTLWCIDQPGQTGVSGWRVTGNVRAGGRQAD